MASSIPLTLRKGSPPHALVQPLTPLNADDVVFTWQRLLDKQHPYHDVSGGEYPYFYSLGLDQLIKRVYKKGTDQVVFELNRPDASFLATLASDYAIVLSAEYAGQLQRPAPGAHRQPPGGHRAVQLQGVSPQRIRATCATPVTGAARPRLSSSSTTSLPNRPSGWPSC